VVYGCEHPLFEGFIQLMQKPDQYPSSCECPLFEGFIQRPELGRKF